MLLIYVVIAIIGDPAAEGQAFDYGSRDGAYEFNTSSNGHVSSGGPYPHILRTYGKIIRDWSKNVEFIVINIVY